MANHFSRVRAAVTDGRLHNVYWRQGQLERLHGALVKNADELQEAIRRDTGNSVDEARIEYLMALSNVRKQYASLDPAKELEKEYRVANGLDSPDARQPAGLVYIEPTSFTLLYSVVSPLSSAIGSGDCVILKLQNDLRQLTGLLKKLLHETLDGDIFEIVHTNVADSDIPLGTVRVLQSFPPLQPLPTDLVSPSAARVVAVVDRTADLDKAADTLVTARFSFNGKSPYAPDIVLVNDFMVGKFLSAVTQHSIRYHAKRRIVSAEKEISRHSRNSGMLSELQLREDIVLVTSDSKGAVIELKQRNSALLDRKVSEPTLLVHAISSLDDAIDLSNSNGNLLAVYNFADNASCKYLGQSIDSEVAFANHVPGDILVGPAAPRGFSVSVDPRYQSQFFTVPRPQYVNFHRQSALVSDIISERESHAELAKWDVESRKLPIDTKRSTGEMLGFFEHGIVTGVSFLFTSVLVGLGTAAYYGIQVWRRH